MDLQEVSDIFEIQKLKARYFRYLDTLQWDEFRKVFTDDLTFFLESSRTPQSDKPTWSTADELVDNLRKSHPDRVSVHQGHMAEIDFVDENTATGIWAMYDWVDDPRRDGAFQGFGHYHERYVRGGDGQWRISSVHLTRLRVDEVPHQVPTIYPRPSPAT